MLWLQFICLLGFVFAGSVFAFEGGEVENSVRWYTASPWLHRAADTTGLSIVWHLPLSYQDPLKGKWSKAGNDSQRIAAENAAIHGMALPTLSAQIPFSEDGILLVGWIPEASFSLGSTRKNFKQLVADSSAQSKLDIDATLYSSTQLDASWSTLQLGYRIIASKDLQVSFEILRHAATLRASGSSLGNALVALESEGANGDPLERETVQTNFGEDQFQSTWSGNYKGSAWGAKLELQLGPIYYSGQMGVDLHLKGSYQLSQTLPFFVDSLTLALNADSADAWTTPERRDALLNDSIYSSSFGSHTDMVLHIPQIHTIGLQFTSWGSVDYTWVRSPFALSTTPDSLRSSLDFRTRLQEISHPEHIGMLHALFRHGGMDLGVLWKDSAPLGIVSVSGYNNWGPVGLSVQADALPWLRLFLGVNYAL